LDFVTELKKAAKKIILVLVQGRPRTFARLIPLVDAILYAYLPGPYGGPAVANIVFGKTNPYVTTTFFLIVILVALPHAHIHHHDMFMESSTGLEDFHSRTRLRRTNSHFNMVSGSTLQLGPSASDFHTHALSIRI
jgi:hypothetical protein